ncbi:MAG: hypothetical protein JSW63_11510 [Ignavibacterium sp.]|nr:MAG: hypothetical protein JSW63_11510 [Ignavibacterium sp.]
MKCSIKYKLLVVLLIIYCPVETFSWEKYEHRILADLALDSTLSLCGINFTDSLIIFPGEGEDIILSRLFWESKSYGRVSAFFSGEDISQSRCQIKGYTIQQQLEPLSAEIIDNVWERIKNSPEDIQSVEVPNQNVVFNYFLYHLIALRFAELSGKDNQDAKEFLRYALIYEAVAQSYLSDAFSAGHLLLPVFDFLAPLNSNNIRITHDFYCSEGVYVINAEGDCWRAFGDKLLQWYAPSFNHVFEASVKSLLELFLVYFTFNKIELAQPLSKWAESIDSELNPRELVELWLNTYSGEEYFSEIKMPALLYIPIPVAATWSVRTERVDSYGIHKRKHYPQLSEDKFHDPDLNGIDTEFLYSKKSIPEWMIPEFLPNDTLQSLIRYHPDVASVRFIQNRYLPPSYQGFLLSAGIAVVLSDARNNFGVSFGTGWGFADEFLFVIVKPSINISATHLFGDSSVWILIADLGFGINSPVFNMFYPRFDFGYARGFQSPYNGGAGKISLGLDSKTLPLGFTYAGLTFQLKYQFIFFEKTFSSPVLEIILH